MFLSNSRNYCAPVNFAKAIYGCFKLAHFPKKSGRMSSVGSEILAFISHCSANFQPILDSFIPNFKLKYEDSENIKVDRIDTVVFNLYQIKCRAFFWDTGIYEILIICNIPSYSRLRYYRLKCPSG